MSALPQPSETETRRTAMLRTAFDGPVGAALAAPDTIEILANPDGSVWVEKAGFGLQRAAETLGRAERERIIRLFCHPQTGWSAYRARYLCRDRCADAGAVCRAQAGAGRPA